MAQNSGTNTTTSAVTDINATLDPGETIVPDSVLNVMQSIVTVPTEYIQSKDDSNLNDTAMFGMLIVAILLLIAIVRIVIAFFPIVMGMGLITLFFMLF